MTEQDFRIMHSEIIGYYQLIEMRLRGICAMHKSGEEWVKQLDGYELDSFGFLLNRIKKEIKNLFTSEEIDSLYLIKNRRNYWVHECFIKDNSRVLFNNKGELKESLYGEKLRNDLQTAVECDERLAAILKELD